MHSLSVVINTLNEEVNLPRAIKSVSQIADEIVVVDMESGDQTQQLAKKLGAKVYTHKKTNYVEPARNFAISKAGCEWILILDADEELSPKLAEKIKETITNPDSLDYYQLPRKNIIFGKWIRHARWWPDYNIRLFKKGSVEWNESIHSVPKTKGEGGNFAAEEDLAIIHHNYSSIGEYLDRLNRYSDIQSAEILSAKVEFRWQELFVKPANEFFARYYQGQGYKDGLHGLALCLLQAVSELVVCLKVWQGQGFKKEDLETTKVVGEIKRVQKDLNYWQADAIYKETKNPIQKLRRRLRV